ncbi:MAG: low molecular weight protein arginine phosphatase [Phycisphaeraceae bacterium]|nr:low molecular weight protein arginine phosphatase [Phycisphaeraceae bacterium]
MDGRTVNLRECSPQDRREALARAGAALDAGGVVLAPTETAYVAVFGTRSRDTTLARTGALAPHVRSPVWLAPTIDGPRGVERDLVEQGQTAVGPFTSSRHRRIVRRLAPGPAVFLSAAGDTRTAGAVVEAMGLPPGCADDEGRIAFRVSGHAAAAALAARSERALACIELAAPGGGQAQTLDVALAAMRAAQVDPEVALDDGESRMRAGATVVLLHAEDGGAPGYEVLREGAYEARFVGKQTERTVLFVCTGNTCRSPMAESIAAGLLAQASGGEAVRVMSAGAAAGTGMPMTPEAADAVRELGFLSRPHSSRPLTRRLIAEADVVLAMTRSHAAAVLDLDPGAADKVQTLDPAGRDVPDPIGMGPEVYTQTARRIQELISQRIQEWLP